MLQDIEDRGITHRHTHIHVHMYSKGGTVIPVLSTKSDIIYQNIRRQCFYVIKSFEDK